MDVARWSCELQSLIPADAADTDRLTLAGPPGAASHEHASRSAPNCTGIPKPRHGVQRKTRHCTARHCTAFYCWIADHHAISIAAFRRAKPTGKPSLHPSSPRGRKLVATTHPSGSTSPATLLCFTSSNQHVLTHNDAVDPIYPRRDLCTERGGAQSALNCSTLLVAPSGFYGLANNCR